MPAHLNSMPRRLLPLWSWTPALPKRGRWLSCREQALRPAALVLQAGQGRPAAKTLQQQGGQGLHRKEGGGVVQARPAVHPQCSCPPASGGRNVSVLQVRALLVPPSPSLQLRLEQRLLPGQVCPALQSALRPPQGRHLPSLLRVPRQVMQCGAGPQG